jgi:hypothetical protein
MQQQTQPGTTTQATTPLSRLGTKFGARSGRSDIRLLDAVSNLFLCTYLPTAHDASSLIRPISKDTKRKKIEAGAKILIGSFFTMTIDGLAAFAIALQG